MTTDEDKLDNLPRKIGRRDLMIDRDVLNYRSHHWYSVLHKKTKGIISNGIGNLWNKVYSEIVKKVKPYVVDGTQIRQFVDRIIYTNTEVSKSDILLYDGGGKPTLLSNIYDEVFWVDPVSTIVRHRTRRKRVYKANPVQRIKTTAGYAYLVGTNWYEMVYTNKYLRTLGDEVFPPEALYFDIPTLRYSISQVLKRAYDKKSFPNFGAATFIPMYDWWFAPKAYAPTIHQLGGKRLKELKSKLK